MSAAASVHYLFASSRRWHRERYESLCRELCLDAAWVADPAALLEHVRRRPPRYVFFPHWSAIVPPEVWENHECVCFHMTDLPYGRGGSPLQNLIARGHTQTMLTALRMTADIDGGPVYAKRPLSLEGRAEEIYARAGDISFELIRWLITTEPDPLPQVGEPVEFTRRKPLQSELPVTDDLGALFDHVRMLDAPGYPLAYLEREGLRFEFSEATLRNGELEARVVIRKQPKATGT